MTTSEVIGTLALWTIANAIYIGVLAIVDFIKDNQCQE